MRRRQVIAELRPQGVAPLPEELTRQGVGARLDESGRVRLARGPPGPAARPAGAGDDGDGEAGRSGGASECGAAEGRQGQATAADDERRRHAAARSSGEERVPSPGGEDRVLEELRSMGLRVEVDPDTGLVDVAHPQAPPSRFSYD